MKKSFVLINIMCILLLCGCNFKNEETDNIEPNETGKLEKVFENLDYKSEMIEVENIGNLLKLDYIEPGLDTADIKTVMYSVNENKV